MDIRTIDGVLFADMVKCGAANLEENRQIVNDLNVFPIPDGDTGDNMLMTMNSGAAEVMSGKNGSVSTAADAVARGMLLGARGNSGVILSRIFSGISKGLKGLETADAAAINKAFECGVEEAYRAVTTPVEGTILTVYRDAVTYAASRMDENTTIESYFNDFTKELRLSLDRTPDLLAVLKESGVVDSGGAGMVYIVEGMQDAFDENGADYSPSFDKKAAPAADISKFTEDSVLEFGYCTEFLLRLQRAKCDIDNFDLKELIDYLESEGDSVVAFKDGSIVKVHVHTKRPGDILNNCQKYGEYLTLKIENMTLQHNEAKVENRFSPTAKKPRKAYGIVSVATGKGIIETFTSLGCDAVVNGGQSMNPSAEDFITAFRECNADTILVFPNNGNVILTAKQAASLFDEAEVRVIETKTIGEGYAAVSMLDTSSGDTDAIVEEINEVISNVVTGMVSIASRDAQKDGVTVKKDDYLGFANGRVYIDAPDRNDAAAALAESLGIGDYDIALIIHGEGVSEEECKALTDRLSAEYGRTEIITINGGQPVYDYIMILE